MAARDPGAGGARQLALDLALAPGFDREDFVVSSSNEAAFAMVERWPDWPHPILVLIGPPGSGKSHLGAIWRARARARALRAERLAVGDLANAAAPAPTLLEDLDGLRPVELGSSAFAAAQTRLFHLANIAREYRAPLLITTRRPPGALGLTLPDLVSRLRLAPSVSIEAPDDSLMRMVLVKLLADRQLPVEARLVDYAVVRLDRSLEAARIFVDHLDREALARKSRITRQIAAQALAAAGAAPDEAEEGAAADGADAQGPT